jgi:hypothetical protein
MVRSSIAAAVLAIATAVPGVAFAAPTTPAPAACASCTSCSSCDACNGHHSDADQGPFGQRDSIVSVQPYRVTDTNLKHTWTTLEGAVVKVRPAPGVTRELLQASVNAHMGHMAAGAPMNDCPLSVSGATADVSSTGDGFAITIHSKNRDAAQEILRRANALVTL